MKNKKSPIVEYIDNAPKEAQKKLREIYACIRKAAPKADEVIKYGIPTFQMGKKNLVHFAAFKKHIGFYPTPSAIKMFATDLKQYKTSKGAVQFPLDVPLPLPLIRKMTLSRVQDLKK
jgi:uncharacterized protein YdhG (YjbR/CyaY superfamily)